MSHQTISKNKAATLSNNKRSKKVKKSNIVNNVKTKYSEENGMAKKKWIQEAIKKPGALKATAKKKGLLKKGEKLSKSDLSKLAKSGSAKTKKRVALAKTLKKMRKKK